MTCVILEMGCLRQEKEEEKKENVREPTKQLEGEPGIRCGTLDLSEGLFLQKDDPSRGKVDPLCLLLSSTQRWGGRNTSVIRKCSRSRHDEFEIISEFDEPLETVYIEDEV